MTVSINDLANLLINEGFPSSADVIVIKTENGYEIQNRPTTEGERSRLACIWYNDMQKKLQEGLLDSLTAPLLGPCLSRKSPRNVRTIFLTEGDTKTVVTFLYNLPPCDLNDPQKGQFLQVIHADMVIVPKETDYDIARAWSFAKTLGIPDTQLLFL